MRVRLVLLVLAAAVDANEADDSIRFVRGCATIEDAVGRIGGLLGAADVESVVFVFEQGDFGIRDRLPDEPDYHAQLAEWLAEVGEWALGNEERVRVALTGSSRTFPPGAAAVLLQQARRAERVPPGRWLERLARFSKAKPSALVYVSGPPDTRSFRQERPAWDPEPVIEWLGRAGARLYVVMPEARFPDFLPVREFVGLPESWWRVPAAGLTERRFFGNWASWGTDCPSGFGVAAYARVAAATRGAYLLYPGRAKDWLDPCPFEAGLLTGLLPRMPSAEGAARAVETDPVLREIAETTRRCARLGAFDSYASELRRDAGKLAAREAAARANGDLCAAEASRLDAVARAAERGELEGVARRSLAQLRYSRFLLETCAFHCAAWADAAGQAEEFARRGEGREAYVAASLKVCIWSNEHLRLRDLVAPIPDFAAAGRHEGRSTADRLAALPPHMRDRAARAVAAAEDVMGHEGLSPWGWMVYYSDLVTFQPSWTGSLRPDLRRRPGSKTAENETPTGPPGAPGSGGAGPTTGG